MLSPAERAAVALVLVCARRYRAALVAAIALLDQHSAHPRAA